MFSRRHGSWISLCSDNWYLFAPLAERQEIWSCRSHSDHHTCVLVPAQQRVVSVFRARLRNVCPASHEVLVQIRTCEATGDCGIHRFHDLEVGGKEDVEVALVDLSFLLASDHV